VATHAVGDAAIDLVLDAYEGADKDSPIAGKRWSIEHAFIPRPEHFARMKKRGSCFQHKIINIWRRQASKRTGEKNEQHG
jgi:predicted amidohydrolase YtcJ